MRKCSVLILFFCFVFFSIGFSQNWKEKHDLGDRYEGILVIPAGRDPLQLVSFTCGELFNFNTKESYSIMFYCPDGNETKIYAQEIDLDKGYFMEVKRKKWDVGWNVFGPWSMDFVHGRYKIKPDNLGVLIKIENNERYLPAVIIKEKKSIKCCKYFMYFRPGKSFSHGSYTICYKDSVVRDGKIREQFAGIPFPIIFSLKENWFGWVKIKIQLENNSQQLYREYEFFHKIKSNRKQN